MDDHDQQFCLRWNNHQSTIISVFGTLKENEALVDCTLAAEGKFLKAHKVVLSACSPYFATLLQEQYDKHPIFILKDVKYQELCAMMDYMYHGEVNISQDQLAALLKAAESLQIKGLSDNRSTGGSTVPKQEHHRASMPPTPKLSGGYTLEQTKRARIALGPGSIDNQEMGSREGSSSPSRRRRKMGRRSIENATTDVHDNANSSQQPPGPNAAVALSGVGAITAAASALAAGTIATSLPAGASLAGTSTSLAAPAVMSGAAISGTTTSTTKKTESLKAASQQSSDAMNTDNVQGSNLANIDAVSEHLHHHSTHHHHAGDIVDKSSNHKQQKQTSKDASGSGGGPSSELVIEPKSEYDDEGNDEAVEDLTLDEEDMAIDDLDQNAGTSQGGEGSSHGYAPWQPDRSQNELLLETQEAQQRDPQVLNYSASNPMSIEDNKVLGLAEPYKISSPERMDRKPMASANGTLGLGPRFSCGICGKSYLRKRHLQRHSRDECIGIPPRFNCELCPSRFRRKYHMVRHLVSKHGVPQNIAQQTTGNRSNQLSRTSRSGNSRGGGGGVKGGRGGGGGGQHEQIVGENTTKILNKIKTESLCENVDPVNNGCDDGYDLPENLSIRKDKNCVKFPIYVPNQINLATGCGNSGGECASDGNASNETGNTPEPPITHLGSMPTYGLSGAITAISAAANQVEENDAKMLLEAAAVAVQAASSSSAASAAMDAPGPSSENIDGRNSSTSLTMPVSINNIKSENSESFPVNKSSLTSLEEEWKMKLSLQIISNSILKDRLMNSMPFAYQNN
ncbi:longitudinals lacking isoform 4-T4 [Glossina fuscipes fuscipes]